MNVRRRIVATSGWLILPSAPILGDLTYPRASKHSHSNGSNLSDHEAVDGLLQLGTLAVCR
jgi:hypothetical protein